jgi:TPR repeat protein
MFRSTRFLLVLVTAFSAGVAWCAEPAEISALRAKAERGNGLAQYNLGLAYAEGDSVPADLAEAFVWLSLASSNGATGKALDQVLGNITDAQLAEGRRRLDEYRMAIAARVTTQPPSIAHKPTTRGFSLVTPGNPTPEVTPPTDPAPVTKVPPQPATPDPLEENARLKAELAHAKEVIEEQAATISTLREQLKNQTPAKPAPTR